MIALEKFYYHVADKCDIPLGHPTYCKDIHSWLGLGYYFWEDINFADADGILRKKKLQEQNNNKDYEYEIYECKLNFDSDKILDLAFNEEDYNAWIEVIEVFLEETNNKIDKVDEGKLTTEKLNNFLIKHKIYETFDVIGIRFDDRPLKAYPKNKLIYIGRNTFPYRKRIQLMFFDNNSEFLVENSFQLSTQVVG